MYIDLHILYIYIHICDSDIIQSFDGVASMGPFGASAGNAEKLRFMLVSQWPQLLTFNAAVRIHIAYSRAMRIATFEDPYRTAPPRTPSPSFSVIACATEKAAPSP